MKEKPNASGQILSSKISTQKVFLTSLAFQNIDGKSRSSWKSLRAVSGLSWNLPSHIHKKQEYSGENLFKNKYIVKFISM